MIDQDIKKIRLKICKLLDEWHKLENGLSIKKCPLEDCFLKEMEDNISY